MTLYSRPGCHLCDEARAAIEQMRPELPPFELREIDISDDERLLHAMLERIPVVEVAGRVVSELALDAGALVAALATPGPDTLDRDEPGPRHGAGGGDRPGPR